MTVLLSDCEVNLGNYRIWLAKYPCDENIVGYKGKTLYNKICVTCYVPQTLSRNLFSFICLKHRLLSTVLFFI